MTPLEKQAFDDDRSLRNYVFFNCTHNPGAPEPSWCCCRPCAIAWARERFTVVPASPAPSTGKGEP